MKQNWLKCSPIANAELDTIRTFLQFFQSPNYLLGFLKKWKETRNGTIKYLLATSYHRLGMHEELRDIVNRTELPEAIQNLAGERQTCIQKLFTVSTFLRVRHGRNLLFLNTQQPISSLRFGPLLPNE